MLAITERAVLDRMLDACPSLPAILWGPTEVGKSSILRDYCQARKRPYTALECYPDLPLSVAIGLLIPQTVNGTLTLVWRDGPIATAARTGQVLIVEEISRAPQDVLPRLLGLLADPSIRELIIPETGERIVPPSSFRVLATANPVEAQYYTCQLDKALSSRVASYEIAAPLHKVPTFGDAEQAIVDIGLLPTCARRRHYLSGAKVRDKHDQLLLACALSSLPSDQTAAALLIHETKS